MKEKSLHGLVARRDNNGQLIYKNRNFTSSDFYSNTYMMSFFPKYWYFVTIGSRGRGKTYSGKNLGIKWVIEQIKSVAEDKDIRKFMWWRLTNDAVSKVIENNGSTFFEKSLLEKYHIMINIINQDILFADDRDYLEAEDGKREYHWKHVGKIASIQEYYKYKGNQLNEYDTIIMDELVRAE
ncbi:MAG: hypothetical protein U1C51_00030, partial [Candidatus Izemoplasmatales bacterium]|nr:hypothetical protein [Candidatus Izemoplasmatales bacterium]